MPARATQPSTYTGGRALIEVIGPPDRFPEPVEICLLHQMDGVDKTKHLDPRTPDAPWKSAVFWFPPETVTPAEGRLCFDLDHGVTAHLRPNVPYVLRVRGAGGAVVEERLIWKPIRGKSTPPVWEPPKGPQWPKEEEKAAEPVVETTPAEPEKPVEELIAVPENRTPSATETPKGGPPWALIGLGVLLVAALAGGGWFFLQNKDSKPVEIAKPAEPAKPAPAPTTVEEARKLVQQGVPSGDAYAAGVRYREAKSLDGAFLLFRHAAERGSAEAAIAVGEMYDPATHSAATSPLPTANPTQAADWYRRAAETGNAEAQFRYGRLLASGKTDDPQGPEAGIAWLRKAADQGHAQAKEALPK